MDKLSEKKRANHEGYVMIYLYKLIQDKSLLCDK
jgi:hypothetical protein